MLGKNLDEKVQTESSTEELRFAKRINQIGAMKLKLRSKEVQIQICLKANFKFSKSCSSCLSEQRDQDEDFGVGFIGFGPTSKK